MSVLSARRRRRWSRSCSGRALTLYQYIAPVKPSLRTTTIPSVPPIVDLKDCATNATQRLYRAPVLRLRRDIAPRDCTASRATTGRCKALPLPRSGPSYARTQVEWKPATRLARPTRQARWTQQRTLLNHSRVATHVRPFFSGSLVYWDLSSSHTPALPSRPGQRWLPTIAILKNGGNGRSCWRIFDNEVSVIRWCYGPDSHA
ncbi:hypothetical protein C8F01DRAFT_1178 [Mycena amicta]|nr:hypothetical protein C8F01DRAFT_1178 [Mycena amicta]